MTVIIIIIILCTNFKHVKSCKFWICHPWYYNEELHLYAMGLGIPLKKEIKHLSN